MLIKKKSKVLAVFVALLTIIITLITFTGCTPSQVLGTYVNEEELGYFEVKDKTVTFYNVWFSGYNTHPNGGDYAFYGATGTYTYSKTKSGNGGYEIKVTVHDEYVITAYFFDEAVPRIVYQRVKIIDNVVYYYDVTYYKGTPSWV